MLASLLFAGCPFGTLRRERSALEEGLARVDDGIAARADRAALDEACGLLDMLSLDADDPRLLARQAQCDYALAYGYPEEAPSPSARYLEGREHAWRCLTREPAFAGVLTTTGGRMTVAAAARIGPGQADCLRWLVATWARWLALEDPAACGIDLEPLGLLAVRSVELSGGSERGEALGAAALVSSLTPLPLGPDLEGAAERFHEAIGINPDDLTLRVDLAERVYRPLGDLERFRATLGVVAVSAPREDDPWALENRRARERARALLEADAPAPDRAE
jgi:hypothetical protein